MTIPHSERARQIAGKLTKAQRTALRLVDEEGLQASDWLTLEGLELTPVMERSGFIRQFGGHATYRFSPLGLQVRQILQESPQ